MDKNENLACSIINFQDEINNTIDMFTPNVVGEMLSAEDYININFKQFSIELSEYEITEIIGDSLQRVGDQPVSVILFTNRETYDIHNLRDVFESYLALYQIENEYDKYMNEI